MRSRDPNFPKEIPAIPPPRRPSYPAAVPLTPGESEGDDDGDLVRGGLAADAQASGASAPDGMTGLSAGAAAIAPEAPWTEADTLAADRFAANGLNLDSQPGEIAPEISGPSASQSHPSPLQARQSEERQSQEGQSQEGQSQAELSQKEQSQTGQSQAPPLRHNRGPLPPLGPNATVDDLRYLALGQSDRDEKPWTDSDLANLEDPLPPLPPEPPAAYLSRRQGPGPEGSRVPPAEDVWADTEIPYQPKELGVVDQLLLLLADGVALWKKGLRWVRSQLPADLQRQLSDEVMTAIALGVVVLWLALVNPLGAGGGDRVVAPEPLPPITAAPEAEPDSFAALPPEAARSPEPAAPAPAPAIAPEPTPDQSLIADIQARVSRISRSYGAGLIQSVEVNLPQSTLGINLAEAWYGLLPQQQDEIAQDIYTQAQGLSLDRLQLRDPDGAVVARNPVVGTTMVVLKRLRQPGLEGGPAEQG